MKFLMVVMCFLSISTSTLASGFVDICNRGLIGEKIAYATGAKDCSQVSIQKMAALKILSIYGLKTIPPNSFAGLDSLKNLRLGARDGESLELPNDAFQELKNLTTLNFLYSANVKLNERSFQGLVSLEYVNMMQAQIFEIPRNLFRGLTNLKSINLLRNSITTVHEDTFQGLDSLEEISLGENKISTISAIHFQGLKNLKRLDLSYNKLTHLPPGLLANLGQLISLDLDNNQFNEISQKDLEDLTSLAHFDISGNQITHIPADLFRNSRKLQWIEFSYNLFANLPPKLFENLDVTWLNLQGNRISEISLSELGLLETARINGVKIRP